MERHQDYGYLYRQPGQLPDRLRRHSTPFETLDDLDPLIEAIGDSRIVMLGEATHGTSQFYTWRARLAQRLFAEEGFSFVAVEGDWPPCYELNRFAKDYEGMPDQALDVVSQFERWPTWMWANWETVAFVDWLRRFNHGQLPDEKVGFYGLDVYSLHESLAAILQFLEHRDPPGLDRARRAMECFEPHGIRGTDYARAASLVGDHCRDEVIELLAHINARRRQYAGDWEDDLDALQNARVVVNAEDYYRHMLRPGPESWNIRDRHMLRTLDDLLDYFGPGSRAIVWAHNTHIGDARFTDMYANGMLNLGQLARQEFSDDVFLVGFGSHSGHVTAASSWGAPMEEMVLPRAASGSWEDVFHRASSDNRLLLMDEVGHLAEFSEPRGHRAVGVVYRPDRDDPANYVPTILPRRYDAFVFIDQSQALHPLHVEPAPISVPETYPWGV